MNNPLIHDIRTRPTAFIAMVLLVVLGVQLGMWQIRRADYKKSVALEILAKGQERPIRAGMDLVGVDDMFRPIQATGVWLSDQAIWLANRPHPKGRDPKTGITTGFFLLMPLQIKDSPKEIVWVNRGWAPRSFIERMEVPEVITSRQETHVEGVVFAQEGKTFEFSKEAPKTPTDMASDGRKLQENIDMAQEKLENQWAQLSFVIRQNQAELKDGLDRHWPASTLGVEKHEAYAAQWFGLALMTFLFWGFTGLRKRFQSLR